MMSGKVRAFSMYNTISRLTLMCRGKAAGLATSTGRDISGMAALVGDLFDANYYLLNYPDVREAGVDPLEHYLITGWREGRNPSATFDTNFYIREHLGHRRQEKCPLVDYAERRQFGDFATNAVEYVSLCTDNVESLIKRISLDPSLITAGVLKDFVVPMFSALPYREENDLPETVTDFECLLRYLVFDFASGKGPPGPFFDGPYYTQEAGREGLEVFGDPENSYLHWLKFGARKRICPVDWFDGELYVQLNPDLEKYPEAAFLHFIRYGLVEGRRFHPVVRVSTAYHPLARSTKLKDFISLVSNHPAAMNEINGNLKFWRSETMTEICDRAMALDPEIQRVSENEFSILPPWHDDGYRHFELIRGQVTGTYDNIVLLPFCKLGGADFIAGILTNGLAQLGRTIVLRTDLSDWARPDWFSDEITSIDLSPWLQPIDSALKRRILYELVRMLKPKNVFNVNSRLAFEMFETYGARLRKLTKLHSYYFCADRTPDGREVGYPVTYFANIIAHMSSALIDSEQLATTLAQRYCLPDELRAKIAVMYTPAVTEVAKEPLAARQVATAHKRNRPVLLWAGRFDRQKRFDLLIKIAAAMPGVTFRCWGAAVLDPMPSLADVPKNMVVNPPFKSFDELPLEDCDGLVYTSAWDGLPTILIECGALGMPIVASAVGGVPELIDETTGWPVDERAELDAYIDTIEKMLRSLDERVKRATQLQRRVAERHNRESYLDRLRTLVEQE